MMKKPYNSDDCIFEVDVALCGMTFTLRTDSRQFLDNIRRLFLGPTFTGIPMAKPGFICYCATRCEAPYVLAVETPTGLHLARPHPYQKAAFEFHEWTDAGCRYVGKSWMPLSDRMPGGDDTLLIMIEYVRKRLLRTLINHRSSENLKILHAASLAYGASGLLVLGDRQTGKSTLALACLCEGMTYLAEENSIVELDKGVILPFPTPIRLREGALDLAASFRSLPQDTIIDAAGEYRRLIDPAAVSRKTAENAVPLTHILLMGSAEEQPRIENINKIDLARACLETDLYSGSHEALDLLWQWADRIHHTRTGHLHRGPIDETVALVKAWLNGASA